mmetsp:Transcript_4517/g.10547  ORF Transcript_4517/g.10547 Transcript_4517/m.10547 type:complete len:235 (+) Transcript_4517:567-1271(+)
MRVWLPNIVEPPSSHEPHLLSGITGLEQLLAVDDSDLHKGLVAETSNVLMVHRGKVVQQSMLLHHWHAHLVLQLRQQFSRKVLEDLDVRGHKLASGLSDPPLLDERENLRCQGDRHPVFLDIAPNQLVLLELLGSEVSQPRQRLVDGPDEKTEDDEASKSDEKREKALEHVHSHHIHSRRRELRKRPVHRGDIHVRPVRPSRHHIDTPGLMHVDPRVGKGHVSYCVPRTAQEVA